MLTLTSEMNGLQKALAQFKEELEDVCTTPPLGNPKHFMMHDMGYLLPYHAYVGLVCKVAQDHRLSHAKTELLKELVLQSQR